jgi:hypothetical protein
MNWVAPRCKLSPGNSGYQAEGAILNGWSVALRSCNGPIAFRFDVSSARAEPGSAGTGSGEYFMRMVYRVRSRQAGRFGELDEQKVGRV